MEQHEYIKRLAYSNSRFTTGKLYKHVADGKYKDDKGVLFRPSLDAVNKQNPKGYWQAIAPSIGEHLYNEQEGIATKTVKGFGETLTMFDLESMEGRAINVWAEEAQHIRKELIEKMQKTNKQHFYTMMYGSSEPIQENPSFDFRGHRHCHGGKDHDYHVDSLCWPYLYDGSMSRTDVTGHWKLNSTNQEEQTMTKYVKTTTTFLNGRDVNEISTQEYLRMIKSERKAIEDLTDLQADASVKESKAVKRIVGEHEANIKLLTELMDANEEEGEE